MMLNKKKKLDEISPTSNISQFGSDTLNLNSPTVKLTKYRWVKHAHENRANAETSHFSVHKKEDNNSISSNSDIDLSSQKGRRSRRKQSNISNDVVPAKVIKNMKYMRRLKRSSLLKGTLLGRMLNIKRKDVTQVRYIDHDKLFNNKNKELSKREVSHLISEGCRSSSNESWSHMNINDYESPDNEEKKPLPNPNIYFKPLDTMVQINENGERVNKRKEEVRNSSDHHLLLPFVHGDFKRMDSGESSQYALKSVQENTFTNLVNKEPIERKNTPANVYPSKLVGKEEDLKVSSTKLINLPKEESKKRAISPRRKEFMRSATIILKKKNKSERGKNKQVSKELLKKEKYHESLVIMLITSGEVDKLSDFLSRVNINLEFKDVDGNTPFNIAAQNGYSDIVKILIKYGADINSQNNFGNTAMHYACTYDFPFVLNLLVGNEVDQTILNNKGNTPWEGI